MDQLFPGTHTLDRLNDGPFRHYLEQIDEIISSELAKGYPSKTVQGHVQLLASFGEWLSSKAIGLDVVGPDAVKNFLRFKFRQPEPRHKGGWILPKLLDQLGSIRTREAPSTHLDPIVADFTRYLRHERGLADATITNYTGFVRQFLAERYGAEPLEPPALSALAPSDVTGFILRHARSFSHGRVMLMTTALRVFFQYLVLRGETRTNLAGAVQKVADWRLQTLPKALEPEQVRQLLCHCDRRSAVGRRDYAILLLLARLGLRAGEVVHLTLDAIDWEAGEIILIGKSRRLDRLPLPRDVGAAIAAYLRRGRPSCSTRRLFVRAKAPYDGFISSVAVCDVVRRGLRRAGLTPPRQGAHLLRHGLAKQMLRRGATLAEIGQVLRHQHVDTTAIYAKVDLDALQPLALPWAGGAA